MTIREADIFYSQDKKKYNISKNKELLVRLNELISSGYESYMDIEDLQVFIDYITSWYELKYPERELEFYEGIQYGGFQNIDPLSKYMNIEQLMFRLPSKQLELLKCNYRSNGRGSESIYNDKNEIIGFNSYIFMPINFKKEKYFDDDENYFLLIADSSSGNVVMDYEIESMTRANNITLEQLLFLFKNKYNDELDFSNLEKCIYNHICDLQLRSIILQLVALKLLYSKNTTPERGYERAVRFINEFNKKFNLDLTTVEIDEIINRDYNNIESKENENDNNIDSNYQEEMNQIKRLMKSLFRKK